MTTVGQTTIPISKNKTTNKHYFNKNKQNTKNNELALGDFMLVSSKALVIKLTDMNAKILILALIL